MSRFNWMLAILAVALIALNALLSAPAVVEREATGPVFAELAAAPNVATSACTCAAWARSGSSSRPSTSRPSRTR
jgi:hypothetical protein